ncbi:MAG: ATP-binding cassette domain-containing protein [Rhodospirillales bacterium]|nr:ATP-binding cassette domain-containing protein [Rhodospirillales bacterium]
MSDVIIRAQGLTKVYKLFAKPQYRLLDMIGLLRPGSGKYSEHAALSGIDFEVLRGERVAIIGRNGAGKSTLLKLITQVTEPTSGTLEVTGETQALLEIGSGFHPDFTGRENVESYLSYLGISGSEAEAKVSEIIDFAEIDDYIDQPVKTYSTGMSARLMFSAATAIVPDVLVIDEVLGVGDAYFALKSFKKIEKLCEVEGTTVLLVSHNIYSAGKLCDRMIWIDQGKIIADGAPARMIAAYEASIREQEEIRLRAELSKSELIKHDDAGELVLWVEFYLPVGALEGMHISRIAISCGAEGDFELPIAGSEGNEENPDSEFDLKNSRWGEPTVFEGREVRSVLSYGSAYPRAACLFRIPRKCLGSEKNHAQLILDYWKETDGAGSVSVFFNDKFIDLGMLGGEKGSWNTARLTIDQNESRPLVLTRGMEKGELTLHGNGAILISQAQITDAKGNQIRTVTHGEAVEIVIDFHVVAPGFEEPVDMAIGFLYGGVVDTLRAIMRDIPVSYSEKKEGRIRVRFPWLTLGIGKYALSVMIAQNGYFDQEQTLFFSINPNVHCCATRITEFEVMGEGIIPSGTGWVADAEWSLDDDELREDNLTASRLWNKPKSTWNDALTLQQIGWPADPSGAQKLKINFPEDLRRQFPEEFDATWGVYEKIHSCIEGGAFKSLHPNVPALKNFDFENYLKCSVIRMLHVTRALQKYTGPGLRLLDYGSYFGNFALLGVEAGLETWAADEYSSHQDDFSKNLGLMRDNEIKILDLENVGYELNGVIEDNFFDVVLCMSVIEHVPDTPKNLLETLTRVLKPGGRLIMDTPNLAYVSNRLKMLRGESPFPQIESQFSTEIPFKGHHREYSRPEFEWMLKSVGQTDIEFEMFDYSPLGLEELEGRDLILHRISRDDPDSREMIFSVSRKPN